MLENFVRGPYEHFKHLMRKLPLPKFAGMGQTFININKTYYLCHFVKLFSIINTARKILCLYLLVNFPCKPLIVALFYDSFCQINMCPAPGFVKQRRRSKKE